MGVAIPKLCILGVRLNMEVRIFGETTQHLTFLRSREILFLKRFQYTKSTFKNILHSIGFYLNYL